MLELARVLKAAEPSRHRVKFLAIGGERRLAYDFNIDLAGWTSTKLDLFVDAGSRSSAGKAISRFGFCQIG
jgi:hypothetical protein